MDDGSTGGEDLWKKSELVGLEFDGCEEKRHLGVDVELVWQKNTTCFLKNTYARTFGINNFALTKETSFYSLHNKFQHLFRIWNEVFDG